MNPHFSNSVMRPSLVSESRLGNWWASRKHLQKADFLEPHSQHVLILSNSFHQSSSMSDATNNSCILYGKGCTSATNYPQFIDTEACLCGLLNSREAPYNGEIEEKWRCIGNASDNMDSGGNGKWYNTSLPSQELSGINEPQNWGQNPPDLSQVYVLEDTNGKPVYQRLTSNGSPDLIGTDKDCTGKNDTGLSESYYRKGEGVTVPSSSSTSTSAMSATAGSSTTQTGSTTTASTTGSSTTSASSSTSPGPTNSPKSDAHRGGLKAMFLVGILLVPLVTLMA